MADDADKKDEINWVKMRPQITKLALELGPLVVFYIANARAEIYTATAWFMAAMVASLIVSWLLFRKLAVMPVVTAVVVLVFGGLALYFHDPAYIKMKPTIINTLFAVALLGGLGFRQSLLRHVFGDVYKLKPQGWAILTLRWGLFFLFLAVLNEVVWRGAEALIADPKGATDLWVTFKVWGTMPITVIFTMFQMPVLSKYALDADAPIVDDPRPSRSGPPV